MAKLAIIGHEKRGKEVIEILKMLGGKNNINYEGDLTRCVYHINEEGIIEWKSLYPNSSFILFTLEDFLEKKAFAGCSSLATLNIPTTIKFIGEQAFKDCESLDESTSLNYNLWPRQNNQNRYYLQ